MYSWCSLSLENAADKYEKIYTEPKKKKKRREGKILALLKLMVKRFLANLCYLCFPLKDQGKCSDLLYT